MTGSTGYYDPAPAIGAYTGSDQLLDDPSACISDRGLMRLCRQRGQVLQSRADDSVTVPDPQSIAAHVSVSQALPWIGGGGGGLGLRRRPRAPVVGPPHGQMNACPFHRCAGEIETEQGATPMEDSCCHQDKVCGQPADPFQQRPRR